MSSAGSRRAFGRSNEGDGDPGSAVVFEKTNRFSFLGYPLLPPDEEGFFVVQADGTKLRPLGPASRESISSENLTGVERAQPAP